jgi:hypothetical protein
MASFSKLGPIRRHSFSHPIVCSAMLRRLYASLSKTRGPLFRQPLSVEHFVDSGQKGFPVTDVGAADAERFVHGVYAVPKRVKVPA